MDPEHASAHPHKQTNAKQDKPQVKPSIGSDQQAAHIPAGLAFISSTQQPTVMLASIWQLSLAP